MLKNGAKLQPSINKPRYKEKSNSCEKSIPITTEGTKIQNDNMRTKANQINNNSNTKVLVSILISENKELARN